MIALAQLLAFAVKPMIRRGRARLTQRRGEAGFTVVEIVVSLSILALSLSALLFVISNAVVQTGRAENAAQAASLAQSLIAEVATDTPLRNGEWTGTSENGLRWRLRMEPYIAYLRDKYGRLYRLPAGPG